MAAWANCTRRRTRWNAIGIINQPLASIAKREEIIYVLGQENEPVVLDRFSPILHLVQTIRDEAHRFAVTFHRTRRNARTLTSELDQIPGNRRDHRTQTAEGVRQFGTGPADYGRGSGEARRKGRGEEGACVLRSAGCGVIGAFGAV